MSVDLPIDADAKQYLESFGIEEILKTLLSELLALRPEQPIEYLIKQLQENYLTNGTNNNSSSGERGAGGSDGEATFTEGRRVAISDSAPRLSAATTQDREKSHDELLRLEQVMSKIPLFQGLESDERSAIYNQMYAEERGAGHVIIQQGNAGDNFYVLERGVCEVYKSMNEGEEAQHVYTYNAGEYFGELALIYDSPRAASVHAKTDVRLWCLQRGAYRASLMKRTTDKRQTYGHFLETVDILSSLDSYERLCIADALEQHSYPDGKLIVRQGDPGDSFFLVLSGQVRVTQRVEDQEGQVGLLGPSEYFGEVALLVKRPRAASCYAVGETQLARLSRTCFERLLGPCEEILRRNMDLYQKYVPKQERDVNAKVDHPPLKRVKEVK